MVYGQTIRASGGTDVAKRLVDLAVGLVLAVVAVVVIVVLGIAVAVSLRASPLFAQRRVGRGEGDVLVVKLRTFPPSTPRYLPKHELAREVTTPLCRFVRRHHLDELPQLLAVPLGRLSLVGPRPEMRFLHDRMDREFAVLRTSIRPGLTGLWQVSVACVGLLGEAPEYDRFYVEHRTVRMDLWILWRSVLKVLHVGRLIDLSDVPRYTLRRGDTSHGELRRPAALSSADELPGG